MLNHTSIATRLRELEQAQSAAERKAAAPFVKERESLKELCGGLGHQFGGLAITHDGSSYRQHQVCAICAAVSDEYTVMTFTKPHIEVYQW